MGIKHEFFAKYTPQSSGLVERKIMSLTDMVRLMISEYNLSDSFGSKQSTWLIMLAIDFVVIVS